MNSQTEEFRKVFSRLEKLERQNRRMKVIGGIVLMVACSAFLMAYSSPSVQEVVEAEKFVLRNPQGEIRAEMRIHGEYDGPVLRFYDNNGVMGLNLGIWEDSPRINLLGKRDNAYQINNTISLEIKDGVSQLRFEEKMLKERISINLSEKGPSIFISEDTGDRLMIGVTALDGDMPTIYMQSNDPKHGSMVQSVGSDGPYLKLYDANDIIRASIGTLRLTYPSTGSTEIRAIASIVLLDEEGNVIWKAPEGY